mmetsp:Transcript_13659/g.19575  ORF Transcript_13659/g.19575 Transcript_13659/m.19575 type:complete len:98 (+) Transcript_13659:289-582(+)
MNATRSNKDMQNQHQGVQCAVSSVDDEYNAQQLESLSPSKQRQETEDGVNKFVSPGDDKDDINYSQVRVRVSRQFEIILPKYYATWVDSYPLLPFMT